MLTLYEHHRLKALLPMYRRGVTLSSTTNWHTPAFGILAEDDDSLAALTRALVDRVQTCLTVGFLDPPPSWGKCD